MAEWLVVGGTGFIGKHLVQRIVDSFDSATVVDINRCPEKWLQTQQIRYCRMGVEDVEPQILLDADRIVYLAGQTDIGVSKSSPRRDFRENVENLLHFLEAAKLYFTGKAIIYISSKNVYGDGSYLFREVDTLAPMEQYGITKAMADVMCQGYRDSYGLPITILRNTSTYGPYGRPDLVISIFIKNARANKPITIYGRGTKKYDFNYIDNLIDAIMLAATKEGSGTYNIGSGHATTLEEWAKKIVGLCNSKSEIKFDKSREDESKQQLMNIQRAINTLGYLPKVGPNEGLQKTIEWFRSQMA